SQHINALRAYLGRIGQQALGASIDETLFDASFQRVLPNRKPKKFEQLSLGEFIDLLLHEHAWQQLAPQMQLDRNAVRHLLNNIRETRNQLAHFRGEISPAQRSQLRFCWNWLQQYQLIVTDTTAQPDGFGADVAKASLSGSESEIAYSSVDMGSRGYEDESDDQVSRYSPLSTYLQNEGAEQENIKLTFAKIEQIIGQELPASARVHRSWWANDSQGHVQAQSWLEIGWRVSSVNLSAQVVTFSPVKERQKLYIDFFSALLQDLRQLPDFPLRDAASPGGASWFKLSRLAPSGTDQVVMIVVAFARQSQCRVELYIHSGDRQDKWVFDQLHGQKEAIEAAVGEALSWQRLDTKQASRIALYHPGRITDPPAKLAELREWAVAAIVRLSTALLAQAEEAVSELAQPVL
ncbi:MAG: DUF4268 domain-containing protein, partial [Caldilineaceae bacterium]|nr:DUF4268 domain-containing protein [Caldilineaceae bacterium]